MDLNIAGRTALVLGSTSGLGAAIATALGDEGANVVVTGRRDELAHAIASALPSAIAVPSDLQAPGAVDAVLTATRDAFGEPDIVVLNGPGPKPGPATQLDETALRAAVDGLLVPHVRMVQLTLPGMRSRGWGRVLAVGSSGVVAPLPSLVTSNLARSALAAYLKTLAAEVAADGVTVNMLLPGRIETDRTASLDAAAAERGGTGVEDVRADSEAKIPMRRYGRPSEFGAVGAFLCSDRASYVTGSLVRCDGGLLANL